MKTTTDIRGIYTSDIRAIKAAQAAAAQAGDDDLEERCHYALESLPLGAAAHLDGDAFVISVADPSPITELMDDIATWHEENPEPRLCDYETGEDIREATRGELELSLMAVARDGGHGAIMVDGRKCYVQD